MKRDKATTPLEHLAHKKRPQDEVKQVKSPETKLGVPEFLYKYRSLSGDYFRYTQDIFVRRRLFLNDARSLNDPHEGFAKEDGPALHSISGLVACFTTNEINSLMWSHYADAHRGICIGFRTSACATLQSARPITYQRSLPTTDILSENRDTILLTKSIDWKYEQEWRFVQPIRYRSNYISLHPNSIASVIVGLHITEEDVQWVQYWIRSFGGQIALLQTARSFTTYNMTIEPYDRTRFDPDD